MATTKSDGVTNIEASPIVLRDRKSSDLKTIIDTKTIATTDIDNADDNILICPIPSNAVITDVSVLNTDLDSNGTPTLAFNLGLAYSGIGGNQYANGNTSGTVIDADCFASAATTFQAATTSWTSLMLESGVTTVSEIGQEAWELGGLSADPGGTFYILIDLSTAAATAATGNIAVKVDYIG